MINTCDLTCSLITWLSSRVMLRESGSGCELLIIMFKNSTVRMTGSVCSLKTLTLSVCHTRTAILNQGLLKFQFGTYSRKYKLDFAKLTVAKLLVPYFVRYRINPQNNYFCFNKKKLPNFRRFRTYNFLNNFVSKLVNNIAL